MKKNRNAVLIISLCAVLVCVISLFKKNHQPEPVYPVKRHIQYSFSLHNKTGQVSKNVEFSAYAPAKQTATQQCLNLESSHPYLLRTDYLGNQVMVFSFEQFPPYATKIINIGADLALSNTPNQLMKEENNLFLQPQIYCESNHPEIVSTAENLKHRDKLKTVKNIYQWVSGNIRYEGYLKNPRGALYALETKKGDCTEAMYLFAALCRATNIPSKCINGYVCKKNRVLKPTDHHNWSEFFYKGLWRISDPQKRIFMKDSADYIAMKIIMDSNDHPDMQFDRFRIKGNGIKARMN